MFFDPFSKFFTDRFVSKFAVKLSLTTPHNKRVTALLCETLMSEN